MADAPNPADPTPLELALRYAELGVRVLPIRPGTKHPPMASWQHAATVDPRTIHNWWNGLYKGAGVGLAMGTQPDGRHLVAVDLDRHDPEADGVATLDELEHVHGRLPATWHALTGNGGVHLIYAVPRPIGNGAAGQIGPGIDIRGAGGYVVAPPSTNGDGTAYMWRRPLHLPAPAAEQVAA